MNKSGYICVREELKEGDIIDITSGLFCMDFPFFTVRYKDGLPVATHPEHPDITLYDFDWKNLLIEGNEKDGKTLDRLHKMIDDWREESKKFEDDPI